MGKNSIIYEFIKKNKIIVAAASALVVVAVATVVILASGGSEEEPETKKEAVVTTKQETTVKDKETTKSETTTVEETSDETTEEETTVEETASQEVTTNQVPATSGESHTTVAQVSETTKEPVQTTQPQTTQPQTTEENTTAAPRGRDGVILEELWMTGKFRNYVTNELAKETRAVPKTYMELKQQEPQFDAYSIYYYSRAVIQKKLFNNEIEFEKTKLEDITAIYGDAIKVYGDDAGNKGMIYRYGYYTDGNDYETIYIIFKFHVEINSTLATIVICNGEDLDLT